MLVCYGSYNIFILHFFLFRCAPGFTGFDCRRIESPTTSREVDQSTNQINEQTYIHQQTIKENSYMKNYMIAIYVLLALILGIGGGWIVFALHNSLCKKVQRYIFFVTLKSLFVLNAFLFHYCLVNLHSNIVEFLKTLIWIEPMWK